MYQQAKTSPFLSTSHNHNNTQPGSLPPPPPPAATSTTMTDNRHFNPNVSKVDPKDNISPDFEVIARDATASSLKWSRCEEQNSYNDNGDGGGYSDGRAVRTSGTGTTCQQSRCVNKGNNKDDDGENVDNKGDG
jgi:hypothetical protein